ncbi:MAG TPA: hypothetical protein VNA30_00010 [Mycobacteriales bacterium]|nr:hypothetical protein [Mycobacteriales bacterium]
MKRKLAILTAAALVATPLAANAAPPKKPAAPKKTTRTVTFDYTGATLVSAGVTSGGLDACGLPMCFELDTVKGEKSVAVSAKDTTGTPTGIQVWIDDDYDTVTTHCGSAAITVSPKSAHVVSIRPAIAPACAAVATKGVLTAVVKNF